MKPIDLTGIKNCYVNGDASAGAIRVEVLDSEGRRVRGFTRDDATPLTGNALVLAPNWKGRTVAELSAGGYMLRLHLDNAEVFAVSLD